MREAADQALALLAASKSPHTVKAYARGLDMFVRHLWDAKSPALVDASRLIAGDLVGFAAALASTGYAPRTRTVYNAAVSSLVDHLFVSDGFELSPADFRRWRTAVRRYAGKAIRNPDVPRAEHVDLVVEAARVAVNEDPSDFIACRDLAVLSLLRSSGLRVSELCSLRGANVDLDARTLHVLGKGSKARTVIFDKPTRGALKMHWRLTWPAGRAGPDEPALSRNAAGIAVTPGVVRRAIRRWKAAAVLGHPELYGVQLTPHKFRHAFATRLLSETGNLALVQDLLGHSSPETTRIYAKIVNETARAEYDRAMDGPESGE